MKNILILVLIFLWLPFSSVFSQYKSIFGVNQTTWNTLLSTGMNTYTGDTYTVGEVVLGTPQNSYQYVNSYWLTSYTEYYLREDTTTGKVWYRSYIGNTDYLIIDMSLSLGDTFPLLVNLSTITYQSIVVDSVFHTSGDKNIRFNFQATDSPNYRLTMIEGVGRNTGMAESTFTSPSYPSAYLNCVTKDSVVYFHSNYVISNFGVSSCFYGSVSSVNEYGNYDVNIFPNPAQNKIIVELEGAFDYYIVDVSGKIAYPLTMIRLTTSPFTIDVANLPNGYYILKIQQKGKIYTSPFVVARL